jgi:cation diffusion facilitator CzcD-associated flavoprotein CzcO
MSERVDVAVLGAGFGGLTVTHRLAQDGIDDVVIFERGDGVGGTWRANTYPGAACDVPSHLYSLSFAPNPNWSRAYATQPEILDYIEDCYDRFDVRRKVRPGTEIVGATWCEDDGHWLLYDRRGAEYEATVLVSAIGMFNTPAFPSIPGIDDFGGVMFHSARWDHGHDLTGRRVAVVGTGASAIQVVPAIVDHTAHLDVYQRTAPWVLPRKDGPYSEEQKRVFATRPNEAARHREGLHDMFEQTTAFVAGDPSVEAIATIARDYLERKVPDPELRAKLVPGQPFGCKRTLISSNYYPALQRDDVELVTTDIERVTTAGIRTVDGVERPADTIVLCTGFHAAEYLRGIDVVGREGISLQGHWAGVPRAYHGIAVPGFPNFFMLYGPNTNQGGNSILLILEAQSQFVASALSSLRESGASSIEVSADAMARHARELERDLAATVWAQGCSSYFHNAAGDIVTQLPHTSGWYRKATEQIARDDFVLVPGQATLAMSRGRPGTPLAASSASHSLVECSACILASDAPDSPSAHKRHLTRHPEV